MSLKKTLAVLLILVFMLSTLPVPAMAYSMPYYIEVDLTNQIVTIFNSKDNTIARQMLCSAGVKDKTPTGEWIMPAKDRDDERTEWYWMPNAYTWVKYATKFYYAYFFHSIPFDDDSDDAMNETCREQFGHAASHGCIRLLVEDAEFIAKECLKGTYVRIYRSGVKNENLRSLLFNQGTYIQGMDQTYSEFLGISANDLGQGCAGSDVEDLQHRLNDLGYYNNEIDGAYGNDTIAAVVKVQTDLGLLPTGICSASLKELLFSDNAPVQTGKTTLSEGQSGPVVEKLQEALQSLGIYQGPLDTIYDAEVAEAVANFQRLCGLEQNGVASPEVQHAIYYVLKKIHTEVGADFNAEQVLEEVVYGTLNAKANIIVRQKPNTESNRVGIVEIGDRIMVLKVEGEWAQVVCDGSVGYIYKKYLANPEYENLYTMKYTSDNGSSFILGTSVQNLTTGNKDLLKEIHNSYTSGAEMDYLHETAIEYATVNTGDDGVKLNLRAAASSDSAVLDMAANGASMRVLSKDGEWTQAVYNGQIAYLMTSYLEFWQGDMDDAETVLKSQRTTEGLTTTKAKVIANADSVGAKVHISSMDDASIYVYAPADLEVEVLSFNTSTGWALIGYEGNYGFMHVENLSFTA